MYGSTSSSIATGEKRFFKFAGSWASNDGGVEMNELAVWPPIEWDGLVSFSSLFGVLEEEG